LRPSLPAPGTSTATVATNSTLALENGVVVKGYIETPYYGEISVVSSGKLYSSGTTSSGLVFTSVRDDSIGGTTSSGSIANALFEHNHTAGLVLISVSSLTLPTSRSKITRHLRPRAGTASTFKAVRQHSPRLPSAVIPAMQSDTATV